jgi:hypothetical protein
VDLTVTKVWDDDDDQDGRRPKTLRLVLSNGMETVLSGENNWEATFERLPKYEDGQVIDYTWSEPNVPAGYKMISYKQGENHTVITDVHTPELEDLSVEIVWEDEDNQDGLRPASVNVQLYGNDAPKKEVTLDPENDWNAELRDLPRYEQGVRIHYAWECGDIAGYEALPPSTQDGHTVLTFRHVPATVDLTVTKVWDDDNDRDRLRPEQLRAVLYADGKPYDQAILNSDGQWTAEKEGLPRYREGKEILYTWAETDIPQGYEYKGVTYEGTRATITNTHEPEKTSVGIRKI